MKPRSRWLPPLLLLPLAAAILSCHGKPSSPQVLATSDLGEVTRSDLESFILQQPEAQRRPAQGQGRKAWQRALLEQLLSSRALAAQARERRVAASKEAQASTAERTEALLAASVQQRRIQERVQISDAELRSFYAAHPEDFSHPEEIRLRHIYRRVARDAPDSARRAARQEMEGLLRQLRQGANFGELAKAHSDSETAQLEGLIGRLTRGALDPSIEAVVWKLKDDELSPVVETPVGFHIFKLETHIPPFKMPFEETRTRLKRRLTREGTERELKAYQAELLRESGALYDPEGLQQRSADPVLFVLGAERLSRVDWHQRLATFNFFKQRERDQQELLDEYVRSRLFVWQARRQKLAEQPELAKQLEKIRAAAAEDLLRQRLVRQQIERLGEGPLRDLYESERQRFQTPQLYHLRLLTMDFPDGKPSYAVYERLERLAGEIRGGARSLAEAARQLSDDWSAERGGDVGAIRLDAFAEWAGPRAQKAVAALQPGELSAPLLIERYQREQLKYRRQGYMLVQLEALEAPRLQPFEVVRAQVVKRYVEQHRRELDQQVQKQLLAAVHARLYEENL